MKKTNIFFQIKKTNILWDTKYFTFRVQCMFVLVYISCFKFSDDGATLTHLSLDKMAAISQTIFSDAF